jgi:hypothetical protein
MDWVGLWFEPQLNFFLSGFMTDEIVKHDWIEISFPEEYRGPNGVNYLNL